MYSLLTGLLLAPVAQEPVNLRQRDHYRETQERGRIKAGRVRGERQVYSELKDAYGRTQEVAHDAAEHRLAVRARGDRSHRRRGEMGPTLTNVEFWLLFARRPCAPPLLSLASVAASLVACGAYGFRRSENDRLWLAATTVTRIGKASDCERILSSTMLSSQASRRGRAPETRGPWPRYLAAKLYGCERKNARFRVASGAIREGSRSKLRSHLVVLAESNSSCLF